MAGYTLLALTVAFVALGTSACGGSSKKDVTPQQVVTALHDQIQESVALDPSRETGSASVLTSFTGDDRFGSFNIFVFKEGFDPSAYAIAKTQVPADGKLSWGPWKPLDSVNLPGRGTRAVLRRYGNLVLDYLIDVNKWGVGVARLPGAFRLLDASLATLSGNRPWAGSMSSPKAKLTPAREAQIVHGEVKRMVMQLGDLPDGSALYSGKYWSNAQAARSGCLKENFLTLGRIDGYEADYVVTPSRSSRALLVWSAAGIYETTSGAHRAFMRHLRCVQKPERQLSLPASIGEEARLYVRHAVPIMTPVADGKFDEYELLWRSGSVYAELDVVVVEGSYDGAKVVLLAERQQDRINEALRVLP